jgi:hypothetical protein
MRFGNRTDDDRSFERALVVSAQHDPGPGDVEAAWAKLAASIGDASRAVAHDTHRPNPGEIDAGPRPPDYPPARPPAQAGAGSIVRSAGAKAAACLLLGLVAGSAATAIALRGQSRVPLATSTAPDPSNVATSPRPAATPDDLVGAQADPAAAPPPRRGSGHEPKSVRRTASPAAGIAASGGQSDSAGQERLAEQVRAVDAAMAALQAGALDQAIRLVDLFHADFPAGVLAPDAELVAIEALAEARETSAFTRRAERFIASSPHDPHAARVRNLLTAVRGK